MRATTGMHCCDNCGNIWHHTELHDISDMEQRLTPGSTVPSGQCPDTGCGSLTFSVLSDKDVEEVLAVTVGVTAYIDTSCGHKGGWLGIPEEDREDIVLSQIKARLRDLLDDDLTLKSQIHSIELADRRIV